MRGLGDDEQGDMVYFPGIMCFLRSGFSNRRAYLKQKSLEYGTRPGKVISGGTSIFRQRGQRVHECEQIAGESPGEV